MGTKVKKIEKDRFSLGRVGFYFGRLDFKTEYTLLFLA